MEPMTSHQKTRLNVQISSQLKSRLVRVSKSQGKKVSMLVRESIEEKLNRIEKKQFENDKEIIERCLGDKVTLA